MMRGIRTTLNISQTWGERIRDESAANNLSISAFIWKVFLLGYEIYKDELGNKL